MRSPEVSRLDLQVAPDEEHEHIEITAAQNAGLRDAAATLLGGIDAIPSRSIAGTGERPGASDGETQRSFRSASEPEGAS